MEAEAPGAPLLALGQTVFWDEPLKAAIPILAELCGKHVKLTAGVHDTDYFAKLPGGLDTKEAFVALPKNDGSTKDFWSAAGEFSALFGSETPVTRETLAEAGVHLERIANGEILDQATEAWGWRGVASSDPVARVTNQVPMNRAFETLQATFIWAMKQSLECVSDPQQKQAAEEAADRLRTITCDTRELCPGQTLAEYYECLLPQFHQLTTGRPCAAEITRTSKLLSFDTTTAHLPRFSFVDLFLRPETAALAREKYDAAISGTEVYALEKFGTGAIPFDLIIPNVGRGTIRLTKEMLVVTTPEPKFVKLEKPVASIADLAAAVEEAFGKCALVGKAITLINMLASEFVFAFHEGASTYVAQTREMNDMLIAEGVGLKLFPILRISHETWEALCNTNYWFKLPERLRGPFGAEVVSGPTISHAWRCVAQQQRTALQTLAGARSMHDLIMALHNIKGGRWETLAKEYEQLRTDLIPLERELSSIRSGVAEAHDELRKIKREWQITEKERGERFRSQPNDHAAREESSNKIAELRARKRSLKDKLRELRANQAQMASRPEVDSVRERRRVIEREAEMARLKCVQEAVMATAGMEKTNRRPSAWWLHLVSPDGVWFDNLLSKIRLRLEPLTSSAH